MGEPRFGFKNLIKSNKAGKIKAFFSLLVPTESAGTIELSGFKVIEGSKGPFVSFPNRAIKKATKQTVDSSTGKVTSVPNEEVTWLDTIFFESQDRYKEIHKEIDENVLPLMLQQLSRV